MKTVLKFISILAFNVLLAALLVELTFIAYYFVKDGEYLSVYEKLNQEKSSFTVEKPDHEKPCDKHDRILFPHPYLVFIHATRPECHSNANNTGHRGPDIAYKRNPEEYRVMILGGSVANQIYQLQHKRFKEYFSNKYPDKKVIILNGALEGWKQPQQLLMLQFYGDLIDAAISIEGYNELIFNRRLGYGLRFETPFLPGYRKANPGFLDQTEKTIIFINSRIFEFTLNNSLANKSKTLYFISEQLRKYFETQAPEKENQFAGVEHLGKIFTLPPTWTAQQKFDHHIKTYQKYLQLMDTTADFFNIKLAVFLQPTPAINKPLTEEEKQATGKFLYKKEYLKLVDELISQKKELDLFSLLDVFSGLEETIYKDGIHYHRSSSGSQRVAEQIIKNLETQWNFSD